MLAAAVVFVDAALLGRRMQLVMHPVLKIAGLVPLVQLAPMLAFHAVDLAAALCRRTAHDLVGLALHGL